MKINIPFLLSLKVDKTYSVNRGVGGLTFYPSKSASFSFLEMFFGVGSISKNGWHWEYTVRVIPFLPWAIRFHLLYALFNQDSYQRVISFAMDWATLSGAAYPKQLLHFTNLAVVPSETYARSDRP